MFFGGEMKKIIKFFTDNILFFLFLITLILLVVDLFSIGNLTINNSTIILLIILILIPLLPYIKKIKFGDFEAERFSDDVEQFDIQAEKVKKGNDELSEDSSEEVMLNKRIDDEINQLLGYDYKMALVKLKVELEKVITKVYKAYVRPYKEVSFMRKINVLEQKEVIDNDISSLLFDVIKICDQAVNVQEVSKDEAETIVDHGLWLLKQLSSISFLHPDKTEIITDEERIKFDEQKYIVKTVIPYVVDPQLRTYIMTQKDLDDFLEGYAEYAEFLVEITKYEDSK